MNEAFDKSVRDLGDEFTEDAVMQSFGLAAGLFEGQKPLDADVTRDVTYGDSEATQLDIYRPTGGATGLPAIVFVPGGGFEDASRMVPGTPFFDSIGQWAVDSGYVGVTVSYRVLPDAQWPSGAEDVAAAISWIKDNGADYGIDPARIVLIGQSAGAANVSGYMAGHGGTEADIAAAVLISGFFDVRVGEPVAEMRDPYFGTDRSRDEEQSTLKAIAQADYPVLLGYAEFDPAIFHVQTGAAIAAYAEAHNGLLPPLAYASGHNHFTAMFHVGNPTQDTSFGDSILKFISGALASK